MLLFSFSIDVGLVTGGSCPVPSGETLDGRWLTSEEFVIIGFSWTSISGGLVFSSSRTETMFLLDLAGPEECLAELKSGSDCLESWVRGR
jgi:hypothetical protein